MRGLGVAIMQSDAGWTVRTRGNVWWHSATLLERRYVARVSQSWSPAHGLTMLVVVFVR